jgi:hypothetical protein
MIILVIQLASFCTFYKPDDDPIDSNNSYCFYNKIVVSDCIIYHIINSWYATGCSESTYKAPLTSLADGPGNA